MALANFIRQGSTAAAITVNFTVAGTATFNTDYTVTFPPGITGTWGATSGSVTFPAGTSQVDVTVSLTGDSVLEQDETVIITITSSSPVTPISSSSGAAVLVIKNDDFTTLIKWVGVSINGTILVGTVFNSSGGGNPGTPWVGVNQGTAPVNWTNWTVGQVVTNLSSGDVKSVADHAAVRTQGAGNIIAPNLIKAVFRVPSAPPSNGTDAYYVFSIGSDAARLAVMLKGNSSGTYNLEIRSNSLTFTTLVFPGLALDSWHDFILDSTAIGLTAHLDGLNSLSFNGTLSYLNYNSILELRAGKGAMAAFALNQGQTYSPALFPITPANL